MNHAIAFGPDCRLDIDQLWRLAHDHGTGTRLTESAIEAIEASMRRLTLLRKQGVPMYGVSTGFGPFVAYDSADRGHLSHGEGLIAHLATGTGPLAPVPVVRATMAIRSHSLAQGCSGVDLQVIRQLMRLLDCNVHPAVPSVGSVGASGDLTPLAHIARVLMGHGLVLTDRGDACACADALAVHGLEPMPLTGRNALGLVNGTSFMSAWLALASCQARHLIAMGERMTGWMYRLLGCCAQPLAEPLHRARGHVGQVESAACIEAEAGCDGPWQQSDRPLQEIYSIRCAPQILGACRDQWTYVRTIVEREINGVSDNPLFVGPEDQPLVIHGGNFQGQQIAFAADALNAALTQAAVLAERQIAALVNPQVNGGAPLLLAWEPGPCSGLAGAQLTATAQLAEMRQNAIPMAFSSIATNGGNQDVVSMGTAAARHAYDQCRSLAVILAVLGMSLDRLNYLRHRERASGRSVCRPAWMPEFESFEQDRPLYEDINRIADQLLAIDDMSPH